MSDLFTVDDPDRAEPDDEAYEGPKRPSWKQEGLRLLLVIAAGLVVAGLVVLIPKLSGNITQWTPAVGDCVTAVRSDADVKKAKRVDCDDPAAASTVITVFQGRDSADMGSDKDPCADTPETDTEIFYGTAHNGFILCLQDRS